MVFEETKGAGIIGGGVITWTIWQGKKINQTKEYFTERKTRVDNVAAKGCVIKKKLRKDQ